MKVDFSKNISIDNLFNEFNLHKIKLIASIENYNKFEKENKKEFVAIDNRSKHLILKMQDKFYDLNENVVTKDVLPNKADQYKIATVDINCYELDNEKFTELLNNYKDEEDSDKHTFYFVPEQDTLLYLTKKSETADKSIIDLKSMRIEVDERMIINYRTSFIMPFTMCNTYLKDIQNLVDIQSSNRQINDIER